MMPLSHNHHDVDKDAVTHMLKGVEMVCGAFPVFLKGVIAKITLDISIVFRYGHFDSVPC